MRQSDRSDVAAAILAACATLLFTFLGGPLEMGAHPFWAIKVGLIGTGIGSAIWLVLPRITSTGQDLSKVWAVALLTSSAIVWYGKARFVASYAVDHLAGRLWFMGWIVSMAVAFLLVASLASLQTRRHL